MLILIDWLKMGSEQLTNNNNIRQVWKFYSNEQSVPQFNLQILASSLIRYNFFLYKSSTFFDSTLSCDV
jgi:hypothetical protein